MRKNRSKKRSMPSKEKPFPARAIGRTEKSSGAFRAAAWSVYRRRGGHAVQPQSLNRLPARLNMSAGFLLDTNVPSETLRLCHTPRVAAWVEAQSDIQFVSVVSIGELRRGATLLVQGSTRRSHLEHYIEVKIPVLFGKRSSHHAGRRRALGRP